VAVRAPSACGCYIYFSDVKLRDLMRPSAGCLPGQPPVSGSRSIDFTYDVLDEQSMGGFFRVAGQQLPKELARVEEVLLRAGRQGTAAFYSPRQARNILASVRRRPRLLNSLLVADAFLVDALVNLGCRGHQLREDAAKDPAEAVKGCRVSPRSW
jgi:hypothetical protein